MPRPHNEALALVDARRKRESNAHALAPAIRRAARDVVEDGTPVAVAARNRGVSVERLRAVVKAARSAGGGA